MSLFAFLGVAKKGLFFLSESLVEAGRLVDIIFYPDKDDLQNNQEENGFFSEMVFIG